MLPEQITELNLDKFSRCEEQTQTTAGGVSLNSIQKADGITKDAVLTTPSGKTMFCERWSMLGLMST